MRWRLVLVVVIAVAGPWHPAGSSFSWLSPSPEAPASPIVRIASFFYERGIANAPTLGSGVVVTRDGYILTNSHVIRDRQGETCGCEDIPERFPLADLVVILCTTDPRRPPEPKYVAEIVSEDRHLDIAVLKVTHEIVLLASKPGRSALSNLVWAVTFHTATGEPLNPSKKMLELHPVTECELPTAPLASSEALILEDPVTVRGYPLLDADAEEREVTEVTLFVAPGRVSSINAARGFLYVSGFSTFGSSGGAILKEGSNALVGVLCGTDPEEALQEHAGVLPTLARPTDALLPLLPESVLLLPTAAFDYDPDSPALGRSIRFDGTLSRAARGVISRYEWDFDGDGAFDASGPQARWRFDELPAPRVTLRVTDSTGLQDTVARVIPLGRRSGFDAESCTVLRDGGVVERLESIQKCIDCAQPGDTVSVAPGRFPAGLVVGKAITLTTDTYTETGQRAILEGDGLQAAVLVENAEHVIISGVKVTNGWVGIDVIDSTDVRLDDCVIHANLGYGVQFTDSSGVIERCEITDTVETPSSQGGSGLLVIGEASDSLLVVESAVLGNRTAGLTIRGQRVELVENSIERNDRWGVDADGSAVVIGRDNAIRENAGFGVYVGDAAVELTGGTVARTMPSRGGEYGDGVFVGNPGALTASGVQITGNERVGLLVADFETPGIERGGASRTEAEIIDCQIEDNTVGILCEGSAGARSIDTRVSANDYIGIAATGTTGISVEGGCVTDSLYRGVEVSGAAHLELQSAHVDRNGDAGLALGDRATARATGIVVSGNGVTSRGGPGVILEGEAVLDARSGSAIVGNASHGVWAQDNAVLLVAEVAVASNAGAGIRLEQSASATLDRVVACCNRGNGVDLRQGAVSSLDGCWLSDNEGAGIVVGGSATVRGKTNVVLNNLKSTPVHAFPEGFTAQPSAPLEDSVSVVEPSLQGLWDAVRRAEPGGEIRLPAGTWPGGIVVTKPLTVVGAGADRSVVSGSTWDGFRVVGHGRLSLEDLAVIECQDAGVLLSSDGVQTQSLLRCRIEGSGEGVVCTDGSRVEIRRCEILSNVCHGVWGRERSSLVLEGSLVEGNTLAGCSYPGDYDQEAQGAVEFVNDARGVLIGNVIRRNLNFGVEIVDRAHVELVENTIHENARWGVIQIDAPCFEYPEPFEGLVLGYGNRIEGNGDALDDDECACGDGIGDVCPIDLEFLKLQNP